VTDDGLITLGEALTKNCKGLKKLEINCFGYVSVEKNKEGNYRWKNLTDKGLESFAKILGENLKHLENLNLAFGS